jgi:hypothetical protein
MMITNGCCDCGYGLTRFNGQDLKCDSSLRLGLEFDSSLYGCGNYLNRFCIGLRAKLFESYLEFII